MISTTRLAFLLAIHFLPLAAASAQQADGAWRVATGRIRDPSGKWTELEFTPKDRRDLEAALPLMTADQRGWLAAFLDRVHPGHPWRDQV